METKNIGTWMRRLANLSRPCFARLQLRPYSVALLCLILTAGLGRASLVGALSRGLLEVHTEAADLNGIWTCDDGGVYYLRTIGEELFWFGERRVVASETALPPREHYRIGSRTIGPPIVVAGFANVFHGRRRGLDVHGAWWDVPKGSTHGVGTLHLRLVETEFGTTQFRIISATGGFGGRLCNFGHRPQDVVGPDFLPAGFQARGIGDVTGTWIGNDGGTYYIRQVRNEVVWFGEHPDGRWTSVFIGSRALQRTAGGAVRTVISGSWADVRGRGAGMLRLILQEGHTIDRQTQTGGFGGSQWHRVESVFVDVDLNTFFNEDADDPLSSDETLFQPAFIKVDGDSLNLDRSSRRSFTLVTRGTPGTPEIYCTTQGCPTIQTRNMASNTGNIFRRVGYGNLDTGERAPIDKRLGHFRTVMKTVAGVDPASEQAREFTRLGIVVFAWEMDLDGDIFGAWDAWNQTLKNEVQAFLSRSEIPDFEAVAQAARREAIRIHESRSFPDNIDTNDAFSVQVRAIRWADIPARVDRRGGTLPLVRGPSIPLSFTIVSSTGRYRITGDVSPWYRIR